MSKLKKFELFYQGKKVRMIKDLNLIDNVGSKWVQIEILEGVEKGKRLPVRTVDLTR